jgi:UDPglucose--hexose-1-phosphate uridylyltransferase
MPARPPTPDRRPLVLHDLATGRIVLVAPRRDERPANAELAFGGRPPAEWCPFCVGNEKLTPPAVLQAPADPLAPWRARVIPNRYPFVEPMVEQAVERAPPGSPAGGPGRPAHGEHEVVIESPRHDTSILTVDEDSWHDAWMLVRRRLEDLAARDDLAWGMVFKNSGSLAGASLEHVHSQLVAVDFLPGLLAAECAAAAARADPFADLLAEAEAAGRFVARAGDLVALVPPAPRQPGETWILPVAREAHFHATSPARVAALADLCRDVVGRLERILPGCDYNWWLHEAAWRNAGPAADRWHWHLEILPRVAQLAGFELGTGCHVTSWPAGETAARLRDAR